MTTLSEFEGQTQPEKLKEILDDNARKFVVNLFHPEFLEAEQVSSFVLATDWLETNEDSEKKLAYKDFGNGDIQILLISKVTKDGHRISEKEKISEEEYSKLLGTSVRHLEKTRYEFKYAQNGITFDIKYDEFTNSQLRVLEVDAASDEERGLFKPSEFSSGLTEVTGDMRYYGYRVAGVA